MMPLPSTLAAVLTHDALADPRASGRVTYSERCGCALAIASKVRYDVHPRAELPPDVWAGTSCEDFLAYGRLTAGTSRPITRGIPAPSRDAFRAFQARHGLALAA